MYTSQMIGNTLVQFELHFLAPVRDICVIDTFYEHSP
jgi:hypothetical protein